MGNNEKRKNGGKRERINKKGRVEKEERNKLRRKKTKTASG